MGRTLLVAALAASLLGVAACGGGGGGAPSGLAGTYVLDVERTLQEADLKAGAEAAGRMRERFHAESYRLEIAASGTFELRVAMDAEPQVLRGDAETRPGGFRLRTRMLDGEAPGTEEEACTDGVRAAGGGLVLSGDGGRLFLRRLR